VLFAPAFYNLFNLHDLDHIGLPTTAYRNSGSNYYGISLLYQSLFLEICRSIGKQLIHTCKLIDKNRGDSPAHGKVGNHLGQGRKCNDWN